MQLRIELNLEDYSYNKSRIVIFTVSTEGVVIDTKPIDVFVDVADSCVDERALVAC